MWPSMSSKTANTFLSEARAGLGACAICGRRCLARSSVPASKRSSAAPAERYGLRARGMRWTRGYCGNEAEKPAAAGAGRAKGESWCYLLSEYSRSPSSRLADWTLRPILVPRVPLMNPRTLWDCQPVAFMSSARLAPLGRLTSSSTLAPLLWGRRALVSLAGCAVFLTLGSFGAALGFPFAVFWPLGAPFALVAPFVEEASSGATWAPCAATAAGCSVLLASTSVMVVCGPFWRFVSAHDDSSL